LNCRKAILVCLLSSAVCVACANAGDASAPGSRRIFAAVLLHRGTAVGKNAGTFGVFVRTGDTIWTKVTLSNIIAFGLGYFDNGSTRRYYLAAGNGVHRSTDGGQSWRTLTSWRTEEILCVAPDPVDSAVIYAATPFGVFKTIDDGATWLKKSTGFNKWYIQRIILDVANRRTLYAASEDDLYRSTDAGEHWSPLHVEGPEILALMQHPKNPGILLVGQEDEGIKYSTNRGASWSPARIPSPTSIYAFAASADGRDLYAAGWKTGLWRSEDGGASWLQAWQAENVEAIYSLFVDPWDPAHLMVGTVGSGVFESLDRGRTWRLVGLSGAQVKQIELYP
jgi:photosystem II stability/assembly factor-like uncharacterized protein